MFHFQEKLDSESKEMRWGLLNQFFFESNLQVKWYLEFYKYRIML
ncbi:hypothetical protein LEP1GSC168_3336 [Leptospira santarosai str. HAI134]|nr:hypothetical protein LEP1GSC168_3336 [Leptospira santarosai str. HAI134]